MPNKKEGVIPVTKIRFQIPRGMKVEDVISRLEISFEEVEPTGAEFNQDFCCADVALIGPFSTVSATPDEPTDLR